MDSGQTEAGSLYGKKREQKVREVQPSINMNSDLEEKKKKCIYTLQQIQTALWRYLKWQNGINTEGNFVPTDVTVCACKFRIYSHMALTHLSLSPIFCLRQCRVLDQLSGLTRPASVQLII